MFQRNIRGEKNCHIYIFSLLLKALKRQETQKKGTSFSLFGKHDWPIKDRM